MLACRRFSTVFLAGRLVRGQTLSLARGELRLPSGSERAFSVEADVYLIKKLGQLMPDDISCCTDVLTPSGRFLSIEPVLPPMCSSPPRLLFSATVPGSAFLFFPSHLSHCVSTITVHVTLSLCSPIALSNAFSALFFIRSRARSRNSQCIPTSFRYHSPSLVGCIGAPASMSCRRGCTLATASRAVSVASRLRFRPQGRGD